MYIAELDRPWIDSPFLLEGFVLEEQADLDVLQTLCNHVFIDTRRSDPASVRLLLERDGPMQLPPGPRFGPRPARATISLVDGPAPATPRAPEAGANAPSLLGSLGRIVGETLAAGPATAADHRITVSMAEPTAAVADPRRAAAAWRDSGSGVGTATPAEPRPVSRTAYVATADTPTVSLQQHRRYRRPKPGSITGLDETADRANLGGEILIVARERSFDASPVLRQAKETVEHFHDIVPTLFENIQNGREFDLQEATGLMSEIAECLNRSPDALRLLSSVRQIDDYALKHAQDCTLRLMGFARDQGLSRDSMQTMGLVGLLMDVGKVRIEDKETILNKRAPLSRTEALAMQAHVMHSVDMILSTQGIELAVKEVIAQHHERFDGNGYPYGWKGNEIDLRARMARIVDAYSAMLSDRPWRPAMTPSEAFRQLRLGKGSEFDAQLVEDFFHTIGTYGVGTVLEMETGEVGIVVRVHRTQRLKPEIMLVLDHEKQPFAYPVVLDLLKEPRTPDDKPYTIRQELPDGSIYLDPEEFFFAAAR